MHDTRLQEITKLLHESVLVFEDLAERLEGPVAEELAHEASERSALLRELIGQERAADILPSAGDPEHAHLRALVVRLVGALPTRSEADSATAARRHIDEQLQTAVETALEESELTAGLRGTLERLEARLHADTGH
jgi:hypothetical protein